MLVFSMRILSFIGILILWSVRLLAQNPPDTVLELSSVTIRGERLSFINQSSIQHFDSKVVLLRPNQNLSQILMDYSGANLKTYGFGGMSNVAFRGGNNYHTAILWNGFNLQDPLNGGFNLSLFPLYLVDHIQLQYGGSSALFGSGAMSASIHLHNNLEFNKGLHGDVFAAIASFQNHQLGTTLQISNLHYSGLVKIYWKEAQNNFPYINTEKYGHPLLIQQHAQQMQTGVLQENKLKIDQHQSIFSSIWLQQNQQELPATMSKSISLKQQLDKSARSLLQYSFLKNRTKIYMRAALLYNALRYSDSEINLIAIHQSLLFKQEAELTLQLRKNDQLQVGLNHELERAFSKQLSTPYDRLRSALFSAYQIQLWKSTSAKISIRKEMIGSRFTPFTFGLSLESKLNSNWNASVRLSKNHRVPTFNDLFWIDASAKGNPLLEDESSINEELNLSWNKNLKKQNLIISATAFNTLYHNLIQWVPQESIWMPINQQQVWARGLETQLNYQTEIKKWRIGVKNHYAFTRSSLISDNQSTNGKQLILTPLHQANMALNVEYSRFALEYIQSFSGKKYLTADHSDYLKSYWLGNLVFNYFHPFGYQKLQLSFRINNLWNVSYLVMSGYAMPMSNYEVSIRFFFQKAKHE